MPLQANPSCKGLLISPLNYNNKAVGLSFEQFIGIFENMCNSGRTLKDTGILAHRTNPIQGE